MRSFYLQILSGLNELPWVLKRERGSFQVTGDGPNVEVRECRIAIWV
jgi:hypothetical protein